MNSDNNMNNNNPLNDVNNSNLQNNGINDNMNIQDNNQIEQFNNLQNMNYNQNLLNSNNSLNNEVISNNNINTQNISSFDSQQSIESSQVVFSSQQPIPPELPKKKVNIKLVIIIAISLLFVILATILIVKLFTNNIDYNKQVVVNSTFEKENNYYVLKDENGKTLLDNIKEYGGFCNGTAKVKNMDDEYGIINGSGKFMVDYGKYDYIQQYAYWGGTYHCFYKVTDKKNNYQKSILKYDGSILYSNKEDLFLDNANIVVYESSTRFVLFETETKYQFLNFLGEPFLMFDKNETNEKPTVLMNDGENSNEKYLTVTYEGKTHIYNLETFKQAFNVFDGEFWIADREVTSGTLIIAGIKVSSSEPEYLVIMGYPDPNNKEKRKTYIVSNGKIVFETDKCRNAHIVNAGTNFECLTNAYEWEVYDFRGNKIEE